jgi:hypothetical protein
VHMNVNMIITGEKSSERIPNNEWHRKRTRVELE